MDNKERKAQVLDLLNQIAILTKDLPEPQTFENYNYVQTYVTKETLRDYSAEELEDKGIDPTNVDDDSTYLYCIGNYVRRVLDGKVSSASYNEEQYYNSNC